ncbi:MAG: polysulfide reductase NrfD [Candidatus Rokubacteria bacterium]|nr:polysulfide reductase NrfD [Candidatus Rokubacteria bacterium]
MHDAIHDAVSVSWAREKIFLGQSLGEYVRGLVTPWNAVAALILAAGLPVIAYRFAFGLGAATNLSQTNPWGIWIGIDVLSGVALAAGGYTLASTVYLFGLKQYYPVLRAAVLTGFLGYFFVVVGLLVDLGRPWRIPYPVIYSYGVTSVMFLVAWHVFLYLTVQFLEFCPAIFEWLGWRTVRAWAARLTIGATVFGVILSTLHQSALGALFLMAPGKVHPLWYSPFIPVYFFVSSVVAGLAMVIVESALSHRIFRDQLEPGRHADLDRITLGLGKAAAVVLFTYFFLKLIGLADGDHWALLTTPLGGWFLVELVGFVLVPCFLFAHGARERRVRAVRVAAALAVAGIVVNRVNVSLVALNWNVAERYLPSWMEVMTTVTIVTLGILTFRWIVNRMPVLRDHPAYPALH